MMKFSDWESVKQQSWKRIVEIKVKNTANSRNQLIFQIPNFPTYPIYQCWIWSSFFCQKLQRFNKHWGGEDFFHWKPNFNSVFQDSPLQETLYWDPLTIIDFQNYKRNYFLYHSCNLAILIIFFQISKNT